MEESSHVPLILPAQLSRCSFDHFKGHLRFLQFTPGLEIEHELEEVIDQVDIEYIFSEDSFIQEGFEAV